MYLYCYLLLIIMLIYFTINKTVGRIDFCRQIAIFLLLIIMIVYNIIGILYIVIIF